MQSPCSQSEYDIKMLGHTVDQINLLGQDQLHLVAGLLLAPRPLQAWQGRQHSQEGFQEHIAPARS